MDLVEECAKWFQDRNLNVAVVGFSGGIDSAVTAALLRTAEIPVMIVSVDQGGQTFSSPYGGDEGAFTFAKAFDIGHIHVNIDNPFPPGPGYEAALPILRNAAFYGVSAELNCNNQRPIVVGTANFSEAAFLGFWGKASDGAQDFYPISHLYKSEVYSLAKDLNIPQSIIDAVPSGDLVTVHTNDYEMIGATYAQIEQVGRHAEYGSTVGAVEMPFRACDNPEKVKDNIRRNAFKYKLPFPGFHISDKLEQFRQKSYDKILEAANV